MDAGSTIELPKGIKSMNFEVAFGGLFDALASPWEHDGALGPQKVSSLKALDSGSDSGFDLGSSQIC